MRKYINILALLILLPFCSQHTFAENGDWRVYSAYTKAKKAIKIGNKYYTIAYGEYANSKYDNSLFIYDSEDDSYSIVDKSNILSDFCIYDIAYNKTTNKIFILYYNGNIDILGLNGSCRNISDLKNYVMQDKTFNNVNIYGEKAYIASNSGIIVVNVKECHIENLYKFDNKISNVLVSKEKIYAISDKEIYVGKKSDNLLDASYWSATNSTSLKDDADYSTATNENISDAEALKIVENKLPNSPVRNYTYKLNMIGERLLVSGGIFTDPSSKMNKGTAMKYENNTWTNIDENEISKQIDFTDYFMNVCDFVQDPNNSEHHFIGTAKSGIYEFENYKLKKHYTDDNSPLRSIGNYGKKYLWITALQYDKEGNLWMCNNQTDTILRILKKDGTWISHSYGKSNLYKKMDHITFDKRGWAWLSHRLFTGNGASATGSDAGFLIINNNGTVDDWTDDESKFIGTFSNQDGTSYTPMESYCCTEDLNGAMWIGNDQGLFVSYNPENVFNEDFYFTQIKIARNDGTNLADYLLSGIKVKSIAIDGGNRKWIGTIGNGVYLISADGQETIEHFTSENSSLISNTINDIAINGVTGEVFFATDNGLCSYIGDAIDASSSMKGNTLKVYPNPVRPEYTGNVHITGLMFDSNVKIVNAAGKLVYEGKSVGGEFTWDCCYMTGKRCNNGIYYALCTDEEGKNGASAKIVIVR